MKTTLKGSLAALAAATLLLGGAGSLAFWTDTADVPGVSVSSGTLALGAPACGSGWILDGGATYGSQLIVPGDTLTKTCTIDLTATGEHLTADLTIATPAFAASNGLTDELTAAASFKVNNVQKSAITSADALAGNTSEIQAIVTVTFPYGVVDNDSKSLSATLNAVRVTATQTAH